VLAINEAILNLKVARPSTVAVRAITVRITTAKKPIATLDHSHYTFLVFFLTVTSSQLYHVCYILILFIAVLLLSAKPRHVEKFRKCICRLTDAEESVLRKRKTPVESWRPAARSNLMLRSSICIMDLLALQIIPFFQKNGLARTDSVLAYGHRGQRGSPCGWGNVATGQPLGWTTGRITWTHNAAAAVFVVRCS